MVRKSSTISICVITAMLVATIAPAGDVDLSPTKWADGDLEFYTRLNN